MFKRSISSLSLLITAACLLKLNSVSATGLLAPVSAKYDTGVAAGSWYVAPSGDDANPCTSPGAACATINGALNKPGFVAGDTVLVAAGVYTGIGDQVIVLNKSAILSGGWDAGFTVQNGLATIDGQGARRDMTVDYGITVVVEHFAFQNGAGSGIYNNCGSLGHLTLNHCIISGNTTDGHGGGIYNYGTLTLNNSSISDNSASGSGGGMYNYYVTVTLNNSTIIGNTASEYGGGIANSGYSDTVVTFNNSTVTGNTAWQGGGISNSYSTIIANNSTVSANTATLDSGGIYNYGAVTLRNSILGNNTAGSAPDCSGNAISSAGYNLIGDTSGCTLSTSTGDLTNLDAHLGLLIGSPRYVPLLSGSPAIDSGNPDGCTGSTGPLITDQRGASRVGRCDIGAYEYAVPGPAAKVLALAGTPQTTAPLSVFRTPFKVAVVDSIGSPVSKALVLFSAPASGASGTFAGSSTITTTAMTDETGVVTAAAFTANGLTGSYVVSATVEGGMTPAKFLLANRAWYVSPAGDDANDCQVKAIPCATINGVLHKPGFADGDNIMVATGIYTGTGQQVVLLDRDVVLSGGWDASFATRSGTPTIDGQGARRGITVNFGVAAVIERFAIQEGNGGTFGGGIHNRGTLILNNCTVSGNAVRSGGQTYSAGGGIYNDGAVTLNNCTVTGNTTDMYGGGIYNGAGTLTLNNCTVSGNKGNYGGGIYGGGIVSLQTTSVRENTGAGIYKAGGALTVSNSAISENSSGGIYNQHGTVTLSNTAVNGNRSSDGGGIFNEGGWGAGTVTLNNSTVSGNTADEHCGAIINGGTLLLNSSTVSENAARLFGGGICNQNASATLQNSILAGNTSGSGPNCYGAIGSAGYNLIGDISDCSFSAMSGDLTGIDPMLGFLEGVPAYHPLLPDSLAVNGGNPSGCKDDKGNLLMTDQRGLPRCGRCDIGAYELQPIGFSTLTVSHPVAFSGDVLTYTLILKNPGAANITDPEVQNTLPSSLSYVGDSLTATSGTASHQSNVITWVGTLNAGDTVTVTYRAKVNPILGFVVSSARISGGGDTVTRTSTVTVDGPVCNLAKHAGPVLNVGAPGSWDDNDVWGPIVIKESDGYKMWYTGCDGATPSRIGLATSTDGITWTKAAANPVLSPSADVWEANGIRVGSVIADSGLYKMWYTGIESGEFSRIGYATSPDGVHWTRYGTQPVLYTGNFDTWEDSGVERPAVYKDGRTYHLWYTGNDGETLRIGHATSSDGLTWAKDLANPILEIGAPGAWDWLDVYSPSVVKVGSEYKLWYSGHTLPQAWQTGYALSSDGRSWTRGVLLIQEGTLGAFDAASADYPSVLVDGAQYKIWYSGLNNGRDYTIGYATATICRGTGFPPANAVHLPLIAKSPASSCLPYYTDNFSDPDSGWPVSDNSSRRFAYVGGEYQIWVKNALHGWSVTPGAKVIDFTAAVSARRANSNRGAYGIQFGVNGYGDQLYEFIVDGAFYSIWRYNIGTWTALKNWAASDRINTGTGWNRLKVIRNGASIAVYVNNQLLATVSDSSFTGLRKIGLVAYAPDNSGLDARFDEFLLYPAACGAGAAGIGFELGEPESREAPIPPGLSRIQ